MVHKELVDFIIEARKRGFKDSEIKKIISEKKWPKQEAEKAFEYISLGSEKLKSSEKVKSSKKDNLSKKINKNQVTLFLTDEIMMALQKRAKKNIMTVSEQIEDILRRSTINQRKKKSPYDTKIDDALVSIFSRKKTGPKKPKKTKKKTKDKNSVKKTKKEIKKK